MDQSKKKISKKTKAAKTIKTASAVAAAASAAASAPKAASRAKAAPKAAPKAASKAPAVKVSPEERMRMIEQAAYYRAEKVGFTGDSHAHWSAAEAEVDALLSGQTTGGKKKGAAKK